MTRPFYFHVTASAPGHASRVEAVITALEREPQVVTLTCEPDIEPGVGANRLTIRAVRVLGVSIAAAQTYLIGLTNSAIAGKDAAHQVTTRSVHMFELTAHVTVAGEHADQVMAGLTKASNFATFTDDNAASDGVRRLTGHLEVVHLGREGASRHVERVTRAFVSPDLAFTLTIT